MRWNGPGRGDVRLGFTLIEMLLVIVIIGVLAGTVVTTLAGRANEARIARTRTDLAAFATALDMFEQDVGRYPTEQEGLQALIEDPGIAGWRSHYLLQLKNDAWGTPYAYALDAEHVDRYIVRSAGPDRQMGTDDDVTE